MIVTSRSPDDVLQRLRGLQLHSLISDCILLLFTKLTELLGRYKQNLDFVSMLYHMVGFMLWFVVTSVILLGGCRVSEYCSNHKSLKQDTLHTLLFSSYFFKYL